MIVDLAVYTAGTRRPCGDLSDELAMLRNGGEAGSFLWVGLKDPTAAEFSAVDEELGLHPLAVEDAVNGRQRPKVEVYDDMVFVVLRPLRYVEETSDIETGELMLFLGANYLVTVRRGEVGGLHDVRRQLESDAELLGHGPAAVLHAVVDEVVDTYRVIDEEIAADLETIEAEVFSDNPVDTGGIYRLKREVLEFRRASQPLLAPLHQLHISPHSPIPDGELRLLVRDVSDHLHGVIDHIEGYDRLLTDILGAHLAQLAVRQNNDMRKISAWVAIAAVPTMVAGIYGMNFDTMPELRWRYGYFVVLLVMATACGAIYRAFKRSGWL
ncbi:MAG: magnesium/cobalt transporter CorA [Dermatophilaceae bacterium]